jgi:diamine N-acetyltransferase
MQIRPANTNDANTLAELCAKTFYDTFRPFHSEEDMQQYIKKAYSVELISENLLNETIQYFIAFDEDKPIGYLKLIKDATHEKLASEKNIELEKIYVLKEYLDKKVGKELMLQAINFSKQKNFETLFLGVWQENHRAVNFYKNFGFEIFTTRTFQLGETLCDDFLMKILLE